MTKKKKNKYARIEKEKIYVVCMFKESSWLEEHLFRNENVYYIYLWIIAIIVKKIDNNSSDSSSSNKNCAVRVTLIPFMESFKCINILIKYIQPKWNLK